MTTPTLTQTLLKELSDDMSEVKRFMIRMEPFIKQVDENTKTLRENDVGLLFRVARIENKHNQDTESYGRKLGYKALEVLVQGAIMAGLVYVLAGNLIK